MKRWFWSGVFLVAAVVLAGIPISNHQAVNAVANPVLELYLELVPPAGPGGPPHLTGSIPPTCATWHELFPNFCVNHHQDSYSDNGDGMVSPCDVIKLDGLNYHIRSVGPTYWTTRFPAGGGPAETVVFEPTDPVGGNPVCQTWHEIHPNFCNTIHVDSFHDGDGDGQVSVCDEIDVQTPLGTDFYHIDRVELDITVDPVNTPIEPSTWGRIKSFFQKLIP